MGLFDLGNSLDRMQVKWVMSACYTRPHLESHSMMCFDNISQCLGPSLDQGWLSGTHHHLMICYLDHRPDKILYQIGVTSILLPIWFKATQTNKNSFSSWGAPPPQTPQNS